MYDFLDFFFSHSRRITNYYLQLSRTYSSQAPPKLPNAVKPPSYILTTVRAFPSLEPLTFAPIHTSVLNVPLRRDLLWRAVVYENDNKRVGSSNPPSRSTNGYSRRKLLPQKGSGRARVGDGNSPIRHNGAVAHGGVAPNDYTTSLPKKVYSLAFNNALSHQYRCGSLFVIGGGQTLCDTNSLDVNRLELPSRPDGKKENSVLFDRFCEEFKLHHKKILFIIDEPRDSLSSSVQKFKNKINIVQKEFVDVNDILKAKRIFIEYSALKYLAVMHAPSK